MTEEPSGGVVSIADAGLLQHLREGIRISHDMRVPAVYEAGGREYVAIAVGGNGFFGLRGTAKPGPNQYMVFALPD